MLQCAWAPAGSHGRPYKEAACKGVKTSYFDDHSSPPVLSTLGRLQPWGALHEMATATAGCFLGRGLSSAPVNVAVVAVVRCGDSGQLPLRLSSVIAATFLRHGFHCPLS